MSGVRLLAQFRLKPGTTREFSSSWQDRLRSVRTEDGCLQYELFTSLDDPCRVAMVEAWGSVEAFTAHTQRDAAHNTRPTDALPGGELIADEPFTVEIYWDKTYYDYDAVNDAFVVVT
jgi:quinol monooxygenase YgiN